MKTVWDSPTHCVPLMSVVYPGLQTQLKEPSVFKHCPFLHKVPHHLTLVDICRESTTDHPQSHTHASAQPQEPAVVTLAVGGVSGAQRAHLLVVCVPGSGQSLTVGPPAAAPVTTRTPIFWRLTRLLELIWHMVCRTSRKQKPWRLSDTHTRRHTHTHTHTRLFLWIVGAFHTLLLLLFWPNNIFYLLTLNLQKICFNLDFYFDGWPWIVLCVYDTRLV